MLNQDITEPELEIHLAGAKMLLFNTGLARDIPEIPDILHYKFDIEDEDSWTTVREVMEGGKNKVTIRVSYEQSKEMHEADTPFGKRFPNAKQWIIHVKKN